MGRRARTTCSPIDSAMEKYHCDIGNRLSGVFMPTYLTSENGKPLAEDFCMLTLDTRHKNSVKNKATRIPDNTDSSSEISSSCVSTYSSAPSEDDSLPKEKNRLVDKLTRALFQRKHTCARCKRRSRSCMPNKTFSSTGKHYMCGGCRETSHAIKSLFVDQSVSNDSDYSTSKSSSSRTTLQSKERVPLEPRTHLNDSGYDTVTSCSTVASAYSAFNSPSNGTNSQEPAHSNSPKLISNRNTDTPKVNHVHEKSDTELHTQYVCPNPLTTSEPPVNRTTAELHQFLGVDQHGSQVLRQVKNKNLNNYDGFLPETSQQRRDQIEFRSPLSDATNFEGYVENGDSFKSGDSASNSSRQQLKDSEKICYLCKSTNKPCFRLKWERSWLCEDCLDHVF